jgi:biopolymer transport protein ExbD
MAMNIGPGDTAGGDDEPLMEINTTPLIDVMLVLLVMLIITIPIQLHSADLDLPVAPADIAPDGALRWQDEPLADRAVLVARLQAEAARPRPAELHIRPAPGSAYAAFAEVMVEAQRAGLRRLGVAGLEQFEPAR